MGGKEGRGKRVSSHLWLPPGCTVNRGSESGWDRGWGSEFQKLPKVIQTPDPVLTPARAGEETEPRAAETCSAAQQVRDKVRLPGSQWVREPRVRERMAAGVREPTQVRGRTPHRMQVWEGPTSRRGVWERRGTGARGRTHRRADFGALVWPRSWRRKN